MKAFGPKHAHEDVETCATPVGKACLWCEETLIEGDKGFLVGCSQDIDESGEVPYHRECMLRSLFGSVGHQNKKCSCLGSTEEDPSGMTRREAASAATELYTKQHS